jgi:hypothetical protein
MLSSTGSNPLLKRVDTEMNAGATHSIIEEEDEAEAVGGCNIFEV